MSQSWLFRIAMATLVLVLAAAGSTLVGRQHLSSHESLILIPEAELNTIPADFLPHIRGSRILPDGVLAGVDQITLASLRNAGIRFDLIDDRAWSSDYSIVSSRKPLDASKKLPLESLHNGRTYDLVRGGEEIADGLRKSGFYCLPLNASDIPLREPSIYLPAGAVGNEDSIVTALVSLVSDSSIAASIQGLQNFGTRYCLDSTRDSVFSWVKSRYLSAGITDVAGDTFTMSGTLQQNIVATIAGHVAPSTIVLLGGHVDSFSSNILDAPGADDNASGSVAALEIARVLSSARYDPAFTLRFMAFAAEEMGLVGSANYAQKARRARNDIRIMLNFDMIGNRDTLQRDREYLLQTNNQSLAFAQLISSMAVRYTTLKPIIHIGGAGSDDASFFSQGYRTVWSFEKDFSPFYHSPGDLLEHLDIRYAGDIIRAALAAVVTLDRLPPTVNGVEVADCGDGSSLQVRWNAPPLPDISSYKISVGISPGSYSSSVLTSSSPAVLRGLIAGTKYYVGVSIVNLMGREGMILETEGTPELVPRAPLGLSAKIVSGGVRLNWYRNAELDLSGYGIYRRVAADTFFVRCATVPGTDSAWTDTASGLWPRSYYLTALDSAGHESETSDTSSPAPLISVDERASALPHRFALAQSFPNPANPLTVIRFELPVASVVKLVVYDLLGREVKTIVDGRREAGIHQVLFDGSDVTSGVYFYRIRCTDISTGHTFDDTGKFLLTK